MFHQCCGIVFVVVFLGEWNCYICRKISRGPALSCIHLQDSQIANCLLKLFKGLMAVLLLSLSVKICPGSQKSGLRAENLTVSYLSCKVLLVITCKLGVGMMNSIQGGASVCRLWLGRFFLDWLFHHLILLTCLYCLILSCPSRIWQTVEQPI